MQNEVNDRESDRDADRVRIVADPELAGLMVGSM